jgi:hypothetical protein
VLDSEIKITGKLKTLSNVKYHILFDAFCLLYDPLFRIIHPIRLQVHALLVCPDSGKVRTVDDFYIGFALTRATHIWDGVYDDLLRRFENRRFYFSQINLLKVFDISNLGRLSYTFTVAESLLAIVSNGLLGISSKSTE